MKKDERFAKVYYQGEIDCVEILADKQTGDNTFLEL